MERRDTVKERRVPVSISLSPRWMPLLTTVTLQLQEYQQRSSPPRQTRRSALVDDLNPTLTSSRPHSTLLSTTHALPSPPQPSLASARLTTCDDTMSDRKLPVDRRLQWATTAVAVETPSPRPPPAPLRPLLPPLHRSKPSPSEHSNSHSSLNRVLSSGNACFQDPPLSSRHRRQLSLPQVRARPSSFRAASTLPRRAPLRWT